MIDSSLTQTVRITVFSMALTAGSSVVLLCGCARGGDGAQSPTVVQIDREGKRLPETFAERDECYRRAYVEGLRLVKTGQYGLAIGAFETAVELRPDAPEALFNLGACHESIGDPLQAINFYRRVLDLSPADADAYRNLGTSFIKLYYREKSPAWRKMAQDAWERSLRLKPDQPDVRAYLANRKELD